MYKYQMFVVCIVFIGECVCVCVFVLDARIHTQYIHFCLSFSGRKHVLFSCSSTNRKYYEIHNFSMFPC